MWLVGLGESPVPSKLCIAYWVRLTNRELTHNSCVRVLVPQIDNIKRNQLRFSVQLNTGLNQNISRNLNTAFLVLLEISNLSVSILN